MVVLVIPQNEEDPIKNEVARVATTFPHYNIVKDNSNDASGNYSSSKRKSYNVSNIPTDFLNNRDVAIMIL